MKIVHGLAFPEADEFMVGQVSVEGTYQLAHLTEALRHVRNVDCAIDGGAHIGTWSRVMSGRFAKVIAAEPSPDTFAALRWNLEQSACTNVDARHCALGERAGYVSVALDAEQAQRGNTGARFVKPDPNSDIPVETIDSWHLASLGFLKLDVEGSEPAALRGAKDTLARCRPIVLFENKFLWSRHYGLPKDAVSRFLTSQQYRMVAKVSRDEIWAHR